MNALTPARTSVPVLTPTNFDQLVMFANMAAKSGLVPSAYNNKPEAIMIACQMGSELGFSPMQSLQSIAVIGGRPGVFGDGLIGLCRQSPLCEDIHERIEGEGDAREAICLAKRRGSSPVEGRFSILDAKRAGLWGKAGPWTAYPDRMLKNRARGFALRDAFPDVLRGLKTAEELVDTPAEEDTFRGATIEAKPAPQMAQQTATSTIQTAAADRRESVQAAAVIPPAKKMTIAEFLDAIDRELDLAPEADAVEALMRSARVTEARSFLKNGAGARLAAWTERAEAKRQALKDDAAEAAIPLETMPAVDPALLGDLPADVDAWPMAAIEG